MHDLLIFLKGIGLGVLVTGILTVILLLIDAWQFRRQIRLLREWREFEQNYRQDFIRQIF